MLADLRKPLISFLLSAPVATAYLYLFGVIFTQSFYAEFAIPMRVLEFGVVDYVERSWNAFFEMAATIGVVRPLVVGAIWLVLRSDLVGRRSRLATLSVALLAVWAYWPSGQLGQPPERLWNWLVAVTTAVLAALSLAQAIQGGPNGAKVSPGLMSAGIAILVISVGYTLTLGAAREGFAFACFLDVNRSIIPVGSILAPHDLGIGDRKNEGDWVRHDGLRIYNRVPAGLLVFERYESPRNGMTIIDGDIQIIVTLEHDREDLGEIEPGRGCDQVLG
jgi:hypothetical protein